MNHSKPATPFCGDYRQFQTLSFSGEETTLTPWQHLATETLSDAIKTWLIDHECDTHTSVSMQYYNVTHDIKHPLDRLAMIAMLKEWSKSVLWGAHGSSEEAKDEAFLSTIFDELTPDNLRAFGELFYHYGAKGPENWLLLVHQLYQKFPNHFSIYKHRLLDPLLDWSECLAKEEVDAFTTSMQKLDHYPVYQTILWALIDVHGDTVITQHGDRRTPMRYAEVWRAYNKIIDYIDANHLVINEAQFVNAINQYQGQFNASQFLRRLYEVLQKTGDRQESTLVQQDILNHLGEIDWRENGFYYACVHEHYRYWDNALALNDLQSLDNLKTPTYIVTWDDPTLDISDTVGFTLRYAAQRLQLSKIEFDKFKKTITGIAQHHGDNSALFRLIAGSLALGVDNVDSIAALEEEVWNRLQNKKYQPILSQINQNISLDSKELISRSYHLRIGDLPVLLEALTEMGISDVSFLNLETVNSLGRAIQCYSDDKKDQLKQLIHYGLTHGFDHPLVTAYPWLINDPIETPPTHAECQKFYKQLRSIDFSNSKLPDKETLTAILQKVQTSDDRHEAVHDLVSQGCFITDQDAEFRVLNASEKRLIDEMYLSKTFGVQNRHLLGKLFEHLAVKEEGNTHEKIKKLLQCFSNLDKKNYYD
ncbi:MAG TPA: hypothetical protein VHD33_07495, partial [Legionellaceae bacterium]|nr:hypothetical protein [Legionellaceae bacterium]